MENVLHWIDIINSSMEYEPAITLFELKNSIKNYNSFYKYEREV